MAKADTDCDARARYYLRAAEWREQAVASLQRSHAWTWRLAAGAFLIMLLNALALISLEPQQKYVAYAVDVHEQNGEALTTRALKPGDVQSSPAYTQSMIARYVVAREEFSASRIRDDYRLVELMSAPSVRTEYGASLARASGLSPFSLYPPNGVVRITVTGVTLLDAGQALVTYASTRGDLIGAQPERAQAQVAFSYSPAPMRQIDRYDDPLGFQVTRYSNQTL